MNIKSKVWMLALAVVLLLISFKFYHCSSQYCTPKPAATATLTAKSGDAATAVMQIGSTTLDALVADTDAAREQGLSGRDGLPPDTGMLFIFPQPAAYGFWMKDMKFDLDLIWINSAGEVIGITKNVPKDSYPNIFHPPGPITYVVEVPAGFADAHGMQTGQYFSYKSTNGQ